MNALFRAGAQVLCVAAFFAALTSGAFAERRVALVIGNADYQHADKLANTINDANAIAQMFKRAGFDVVDERRDVGVVEFKRAVRDFLASAGGADIAVVYYSGHGLEVSGTNYLIPIDAKLSSAFDVDDEAVPLDRVLRATEPAKKLSLIILDACRENPFLRAEGRLPSSTRAIATRLIGVEPTNTDTLIAYAAKAGSVSYDGAGVNSPFTTALVKYITQPGLDIRIALGKVRDDVLEATGHRQEPFVYGSLGGADISLVPAPRAPVAEIAPPEANAAVEYQSAERLGTAEGWRIFLGVHKSGYYADLARAQLARLMDLAAAKSPNEATAARSEPPSAAAPPARTEPPKVAAPPPARAEPPTVAAPPLVRTEPPTVVATPPVRIEQPKVAAPPAHTEAPTVAAPPPVRIEPPKVAATPPAHAEPPTVVASLPEPAAPKEKNEDVCRRERAELARLRADPAPDQVSQFWRGLGCADLRPQVQRLMESLGIAVNALPAGADRAALAQPTPALPRADNKSPEKGAEAAAPPAGDDACKTAADQLSRIRANPDREAAKRFAQELKCDRLKAQAMRLLESLGD